MIAVSHYLPLSAFEADVTVRRDTFVIRERLVLPTVFTHGGRRTVVDEVELRATVDGLGNAVSLGLICEPTARQLRGLHAGGHFGLEPADYDLLVQRYGAPLRWTLAARVVPIVLENLPPCDLKATPLLLPLLFGTWDVPLTRSCLWTVTGLVPGVR